MLQETTDKWMTDRIVSSDNNDLKVKINLSQFHYVRATTPVDADTFTKIPLNPIPFSVRGMGI